MQSVKVSNFAAKSDGGVPGWGPRPTGSAHFENYFTRAERLRKQDDVVQNPFFKTRCKRAGAARQAIITAKLS